MGRLPTPKLQLHNETDVMVRWRRLIIHMYDERALEGRAGEAPSFMYIAPMTERSAKPSRAGSA